MAVKLTIDEAKKSPSMFMYVFAREEFLQALPAKYAYIIRAKAANQRKILMLSAKEYLGDRNRWTEYTDAIRQAFIDTYDMTPVDALVVLAQGGNVAGKNWKEGVYGVGTLGAKEFKGTDISVNPKNGYMMRGNKYLPVYDTVYNEVDGKTIAYQLFYYDEASGKRYMSQYYKSAKKYYAESYETSDGKRYSANGKEITNADSATIWADVVFWVDKLLDWILSLFSGNNTQEDGGEKITPENTAPSQTEDGFCTESGFGEAGMILLALAAGGTLLAGGLKKNKK